MTKQQKTQQVVTIMRLIDKYAEACRANGGWVHSAETAAARQLVLEAVRDIPAPPAVPAGPWTLGEMTGNWRDIDLPDHEGVMRIVWRMDDDIGRNHALEAQARAVVAALNAAAATKDHTGVPFQAIKALLDQAMTQAVANGANSVSMPDEIVEVAHWLTFSDMWQQEADSRPTQDGEAHNFDVCQYFDNWLLQKGALLTPHSEESDGPMAPALNWIASVEAMLTSNATAGSATHHLGACIVDDVLHVSVIRKESGTATVLLSEKLQVEQLRSGDVFIDTAPQQKEPEVGSGFWMGERLGIYKAPRQQVQKPVSPNDDADLLDWLSHAGPVSICMVVDRPHDGEYEVSTDYVTGYGETLRKAIRAAIVLQGEKLG